MPFPSEYQRATDQFHSFLTDVRDGSGFGSSHQAYTAVEGVFRCFRRRLDVKDAIRFANILPVALRALFVADWNPDEPKQPFLERDLMTEEVRSLRADHNFATGETISVVSKALRQHVGTQNFDRFLRTLPEGATRFWE